MNAAQRIENRPLLLLSANSAWNILNFRLRLIESLKAQGYSVACAVPPGPGFDDLVALGLDVHPIALKASSKSPLRDGRTILSYANLMRRLRPAAFLGFTPKPNLYGSLAAAGLRIPVINNVTGLGTAFIGAGLLRRLVGLLYRLALRRSATVFFHNPDDRALFENQGLVTPGQGRLLPGSGVDLDAFAPSPLPGGSDDPSFLFVGRLIDEKGAREFAAAARMVKADLPRASFRMLGATDEGHRGIGQGEVADWVADGSVAYLGASSDVRPAIADCDCVVLPSYREGLPRVLLEAAAMARPVIASDVPGCRHALDEPATGYLCDVRSASSLADAMRRMAAAGPDGRRAMGQAGRARMEKSFGEEKVFLAYRQALDDALGRRPRAARRGSVDAATGGD